LGYPPRFIRRMSKILETSVLHSYNVLRPVQSVSNDSA